MNLPRIMHLAFLYVFVLVLGGCSHALTLTDRNIKPNGKSIAIITGLENDTNLAIAYHISESLKQQSRFQVISQQQVAKVLGNYPQKIKGPYRSAYFEVDKDWSLTDKNKVAAIQRALKVDYLYVLWGPTSVGVMGSLVSQVEVVAQLYEAPGSREIGRGNFYVTATEQDPKYLKESSAKAARQIAERTGMLK